MHSFAFIAFFVGALGYYAETGGLQYEKLIEPFQLTQDLAASQSYIPDIPNSWWMSSYVHASNDHDYLILSHLGLPFPNFYRGSILDITDPTYYRQFEEFVNKTDQPAPSAGGPLNITFRDYGFQSLSDKPTESLESMRTWSTVDGVEFDITFDLSAPVILNGGLGSFPWGAAETFEWSMPAGLTSGTVTVNGTQLSIDPTLSMTWYDRQLIWPPKITAPPSSLNWTWFQLHLDCDDQAPCQRMSVWIWDTEDGKHISFATVRNEPGIHEVLPVTEFTPSSRQWTSGCSQATYPLDWIISLVDGTRLLISSVREDQELCDAAGKAPTYEGYVQVEGSDRYDDPVFGFGLVEIVTPGFLQG